MTRGKKIASYVLLVVFALGVVVMRVLWDGRQALIAGDEALRHADVPAAINHFRRAARWYAPGAPHVGRAYDRLEELARAAADHGDDGVALEAWRAVRSSVLSTRSFYTPYPDRLARANERIADLMAKLDKSGGDPPVAERRSWHAALLARDESPSLPWTVMALVGFFAWVGGGFWFATRAIGEDGKLEARRATRAWTVIAIGLVLWMVGLYQA